MAKDLTTVNSDVQGIKNEVIEGYNTALRVGTALEDMLAITSKKIGLMGVAVPSTTPDTISGNVSYLASSQGTYTNFNNLVINDEAIYLLSFEGSVWSKYKIMDLPVTNLQTQVDSVSTNIETHKSNTNNPHSVTKSQVGLGNVDNTSDLDKPVSIAQSSAINSVQTDLNAHKGKTDNPHSVTKSQVGLSNVDNTSDIDKPVSTAQQTSISGVQTNLDIHENNASNPHNVTKSQVGLPNVDNTSDINKPISTATQTALDLKADKSKQVIAGSGLTGGGTLEADRTINIGATDDSVIIGADGIRVDTQNNLTSTSITKPLSANQGKVLNDNLTQVSADLNKIPENVEPALAEILSQQNGRIQALESLVKNMLFKAGQFDSIDIVKNLNIYGTTNLILIGTTAPSVVPDFIGQWYINTSGSGTTYQAKGNSSSADWKQTSN